MQNPLMMKQKLLLLVLLFPLMVSCVKESDIDLFKHNVVLEGDFDPAYGVPVATAAVNVSDLLKMVNTNKKLSVIVNPANNFVSINYTDTIYKTSRTDDPQTKGRCQRPEASEDSIDLCSVPMGCESNIDFVEKLCKYGGDSVSLSVNGFTFSYSSIIKMFVPDSIANGMKNVTSTLTDKIQVLFDSVNISFECKDGFHPTIPMPAPKNRATLAQAIKGFQTELIESFDASSIINRIPQSVKFGARLILRASKQDLIEYGGVEFLNKFRIDSVQTANIVNAKVPLQFSCRNVTRHDTIKFNMQQLDSILNEISKYASVKDPSCLVFKLGNGLPLDIAVNAILLDKDKNAISGRIMAGDSRVLAAPITRAENTNAYISTGITTGELVAPLSDELLKKLHDVEYLVLITGLNSPMDGGNRPFVSIRNVDKLDVKSYLTLFSHVHVNYTINATK